MRRISIVLALTLAGCLPDLGSWELVRAGRDGSTPFDDGSIPTDGAVPRYPVDDCSSPRPLGAMYVEGFESGVGGWGVTAEADSPLSWRLGTPAGARVSRAASGTRAWHTIPYADREDSYVVSPCFDASAATHDLLLTLSRAWYSESPDWARLEVSVDGGEWVPVPGESRIGWYGGTGWSGSSPGNEEWGQAAALLPGTAGRSRVQVRVHFHSDGSIVYEGFAFDDVTIRPASRDLAITLEEAGRCGWAVATVRNVGGLDATGYEIRWSAAGTTGSMPYDETLGYLAERRIEVGAPLAGLIGASVFEDGDENPTNDATSFTSTSVPLGGGYFNDFEANDGGLELVGQNISLEWGEPRGELISTAASGSRAWVTNLDGEYNRSEESILRFPCYDMSALTRDPQISLARVFQTESCCDRALVEVSVDGADFVRLGNTTSGGTNWYTSSSGWSGSSGGGSWANAAHPLTDTRGHSAVRIQIRFHSDGSTEAEGFGLDDLAITP